MITRLLSSNCLPLGLIYLTGRTHDEFTSEDAVLLGQFAEIGSSLLELSQEVTGSEDAMHPGGHALAKANRALLRAREDLAQFATVSTYDVQIALRAASGYCRLVKAALGTTSSGDKDASAQLAIDSADSLQRMVEHISLSARSCQQSAATADCNRAVSDALANLATRVESSHATVHCDPLPVVPGDVHELTQLFENLLDNAITFRDSNPIIIAINVCENDKEWEFSVDDNGIGIVDSCRGRAFTICQQPESRKHSDGSGIGLAVCKRIVDRHGGRIWVTPNKGGGKTCRFTLPK